MEFYLINQKFVCPPGEWTSAYQNGCCRTFASDVSVDLVTWLYRTVTFCK